MSKVNRPSRRAVLGTPLLLVVGPRGAEAQAAVVGTVTRIAGTPTVTTASGSAPASVGLPLHEGDRIVTGPGGRLEIVGSDGTTITVGEQTTLVLTRFLAPSGGRHGNGLLDLLEGILRIRLPGTWDRFDVQTGTAVASVRSTEWLVDANADNTSVFVFDGRVQVRGQMRTRGIAVEGVALTPGLGTDVAANSIPVPARRWAQPRVDAVLARLALP
jgi:hypothetical protein